MYLYTSSDSYNWLINRALTIEDLHYKKHHSNTYTKNTGLSSYSSSLKQLSCYDEESFDLKVMALLSLRHLTKRASTKEFG